MDDWWGEIDGAILDCLRDAGAMTPFEIGRRVGISEGAATSVVSMLARQGRVRVCLVELTDAGRRTGDRRPSPVLTRES